MRSWFLLISTAAVLGTLGANCLGPLVDPLIPDQPREAALRGFSSPDELRSFLATEATASYRSSGGRGGLFGWLAGAPMEDSNLAPSLSGGEATGGGEYSTTNIQEAGVDESDIVKNDGNYIYMLTGGKIHIADADPAQDLTELAVVEIEPGGSSMYLRDGQIVALSSTGYYGYYWGMPAMGGSTGAAGAAEGSPPAAKPSTVVSALMADPIGGPWYDGAQTTITVLDVTDPAHPVASKIIRFEGNLVSSRLIGGKLHLVLTTVPRLPENPTPANIEAMSVEDWLPDVQVSSGDGQVQTVDAVAWDGCLRPADANGYAMTVVATVDLDNLEAPIASTAVTANVGTIYASTEALYLTDTQYSYDNGTSHTDTILHKLVFTDAGTDYVASGLVPGLPLSQYSLGEHNGYLRIATTNEQYAMTLGESLSSGVYVLGVKDASLEVVGKVEGIASGEKIYAARFLGDRGFLVTFRRIDPLFTMDLSVPENPRIVGELKVPGYSDHIQLLDENHLLTIGRNTEESGSFAWVQGVLLTIFDITDMTHPQILKIGETEAREEIGGRGTYSEANSDPKAFNYFAAKNVLAFPVELYAGDTTGAEYGSHAFSGLYVYRVTVEQGFEYLGRIASSDGVQDGCYQGYYGPTRGVFIGNNVFSVTNHGVKAASLDDVGALIGEATFTGTGDQLVTDCFWVTPELMIPPSDDLR